MSNCLSLHCFLMHACMHTYIANIYVSICEPYTYILIICDHICKNIHCSTQFQCSLFTTTLQIQQQTNSSCMYCSQNTAICFYWGFFLQPVWHASAQVIHIMLPFCLDKQTAGRKSPYDWLVCLGMNLATFFEICGWKQPELMPTSLGHTYMNWKSPPLCCYPPPFHRSVCGFDYLVNKWWAFQLTIHWRVDTVNYHEWL